MQKGTNKSRRPRSRRVCTYKGRVGLQLARSRHSGDVLGLVSAVAGSLLVKLVPGGLPTNLTFEGGLAANAIGSNEARVGVDVPFHADVAGRVTCLEQNLGLTISVLYISGAPSSSSRSPQAARQDGQDKTKHELLPSRKKAQPVSLSCLLRKLQAARLSRSRGGHYQAPHSQSKHIPDTDTVRLGALTARFLSRLPGCLSAFLPGQPRTQLAVAAFLFLLS